MQTSDAIRSRRNIRAFTPQPVPREHLDQILEAGRRAPSAGDRQPWDFVGVTDRAQLEQLARVWRGAFPVATSAATIALVAAVPESDRRDRPLRPIQQPNRRSFDELVHRGRW